VNIERMEMKRDGDKDRGWLIRSPVVANSAIHGGFKGASIRSATDLPRFFDSGFVDLSAIQVCPLMPAIESFPTFARSETCASHSAESQGRSSGLNRFQCAPK
jgi:hypothetical protein